MEDLHALLIGVDRYDPNPLVRDLHGAVADVEAMEEFLLRCGVADENVMRLTSSHGGARKAGETPPTYEAMVDGIRHLAQRAKQASGAALIHYSGHGGRCTTMIPGTKGANGLDEGLIPPNLGGANGRFLHDVELTFLLDEIVRQDVSVTLILDSCHSGGMMRKPVDGIQRRRAGGVFHGLRRMESRVASIEELERVWRTVHHRSWRHAQRVTSGWTSKGILERQQVAILAACRMQESAFERDFGDGPRGAFTHLLLEALSRGPGLDSWDDVLRELTLRMRRLNPPQWPVFEGFPATSLFKVLRANRETRIEVAGVDLEKQRVLLDAGVALGVGKGALLEVGPRGEGEVGTMVEVEEASAGEAWAVACAETVGQIRCGDTALVIDPGVGFKRRVAWIGPQASQGHRSPLERVRLELEGSQCGFLEFVDAESSGPPAEFQVGLGPRDFEILQADGHPVPGLPAVGRNSRGAARRLVVQLLHLARFHLVRDLTNRDERSDLCGALEATLGLLPVGYERGDGCEAVPLDGLEHRPQVPEGRWIALEVTNSSQRALHLYVLDLRPDWGIEMIHPRCGLTTLEGGRRICLPLEIYLPPGVPGGLEILQVLGVTKPLRPKALCLPSLGDSVKQTLRTTGGVRSGPLGQLLRAIAVGERRWRSSAFSRPNHHWTTAQVEFEVVARASSQAPEGHRKTL